MPLNAESLALLDLARSAGAKPVEYLTVPQARASARRMKPLQGSAVDLASVEDRILALAHGDVPVRLYMPESERPLPLLVYFHGGGWVTGDIETCDNPCRRLASVCGAAVMSVEYRLAPEHPFPAAFDDCLAAFQWARANCILLGCDPGRIALVGDSAGGNLAAAVTLASRDLDAGIPAAQLLIYPVLDFDFHAASFAEHGQGLLLTKASMQWFWAHYLGSRALRTDDAYVCPARAPDLGGLPPTFIALAECDPLRDDGQRFGEKLRASGTPVSVKHYAGQMHGFFWTLGATPSGGVLCEDLAAALEWAWNGGSGEPDLNPKRNEAL